METKTYNQTGKETGTIQLPSNFSLPWNETLVHQVVTSMQSNARAGTADSRGRGEVRGGGKKPWRQKGTGRARHGSSRSPIWKGGGVTHGPLAEKSYDKKINKKMKTKALFTILSQKARDGELIVMDELVLKAAKTKEAHGVLKALAKSGVEKIDYKRGRRALVATPAYDESLIKSFRNIASAGVREARDLNPVDALVYKYIVLPKASIDVLVGRTATK